MSDIHKTVQRWLASFKKGTDFDSWGQLVEAIDEYQILARHLQKEVQSVNNSTELTEDQKSELWQNHYYWDSCASNLPEEPNGRQSGILSGCPFVSENSWQNSDLPGIAKHSSSDHSVSGRVQIGRSEEIRTKKILAPGEEENLEFEEEEEDGGAGAGVSDLFTTRVPGTLLPRLPSEPGMTLLTIKIEKIGLKDAGQCIDPYVTVSVKDINGVDMTPVQDTPVATRKEDMYVHFAVDVEIQKHIERLPKGAAIFFEFKHYKPKKRFTSTKCFAFMEMDEIKAGQIVIELYKKPTDFKRKKLQLLTKKPLYLHLHQILHKE
ncbi:axin interactor, dorsalization-associated protein isoform X2 [Callorhinchus milii]|uniref:axin interactor, dorsalization-associated protein isoform X2 n=1 Tax=Callorhinchus milii TaxID=7868 RepID=UPI001C3FD30C|nr:axin interactor, dorsalization-associated protein isoform X2 [Callorhinchus milii]